jgi:hypothetical protein
LAFKIVYFLKILFRLRIEKVDFFFSSFFQTVNFFSTHP